MQYIHAVYVISVVIDITYRAFKSLRVRINLFHSVTLELSPIQIHRNFNRLVGNNRNFYGFGLLLDFCADFFTPISTIIKKKFAR